MIYLEYRTADNLVVAIHETAPKEIPDGHALVQADDHKPGDEYEYVITVMETKDGKATSLAAVRQNPKIVIEQLMALRAENERLAQLLTAKGILTPEDMANVKQATK